MRREKESEKKGTSSLRSFAEVSIDTPKGEKELQKHVNQLHDWLPLGKVSRIRMLMDDMSFEHECSSMHGEGTEKSVSL